MGKLKALLLTEGMHGMISQVEGIAKALDIEYSHKIVRLSFPWNLLPPKFTPISNIILKDKIYIDNNEIPDLIISCGRKSVIPSIFLKKKNSKIFTIHVQDPKVNFKNFDAIISPEHDSLKGDNVYNYKGAIPYVRIFDGIIKKGMTVQFFAHDREYEITETGHFVLEKVKTKELRAGDVGYVVASIRDMGHIEPGDTITVKENKAEEQLPGYKKIKPMVFSGLYPADADDYDQLRQALEKLQLNDASLEFNPETSQALGFGFRCGFLGLLHLEIIQERLEREFNLDLVTTTPNVVYQVLLRSGEKVQVDTPAKMPLIGDIEAILEPIVSAEILTPTKYIGSIIR